jgi:diaminohydroxyphosphoribosylaminopyrimidine deaminase/5-amino-6-(5-phosphoribosylamino)uracil reductase
VDAVLYGDGRVEEGVPNSHGYRILDLPAAVSVRDSAESLNKLFAGGVRSVLLVGTSEFVADFARAELVDKLLVDWLGTAEVSSPNQLFQAPSGYRTTAVTKIGQVVRVQLVPET